MNTDTVLNNAIILIEADETECLFDALGKAAGPSWNGGFGVEGVNRVMWKDPLLGSRGPTHAAYAAVRQVIHQLKLGQGRNQTVMCFSMNASKDKKVAVLNLAKTGEE